MDGECPDCEEKTHECQCELHAFMAELIDQYYNFKEVEMPDGHSKKSMKKNKVEKVMKEFEHGSLHSSSKKGPIVTNPKQAIAIGLSEARKAGEKVSKKKG